MGEKNCQFLMTFTEEDQDDGDLGKSISFHLISFSILDGGFTRDTVSPGLSGTRRHERRPWLQQCHFTPKWAYTSAVLEPGSRLDSRRGKRHCGVLVFTWLAGNWRRTIDQIKTIGRHQGCFYASWRSQKYHIFFLRNIKPQKQKVAASYLLHYV